VLTRRKVWRVVIAAAAVLATGAGTSLYAGFGQGTTALSAVGSATAVALAGPADLSTDVRGLVRGADSQPLPNDSVTFASLSLTYDAQKFAGPLRPGPSALAELTALVNSCDGDSSNAAALCRDYGVGEPGWDQSGSNISLAATLNSPVIAAACAGPACRQPLPGGSGQGTGTGAPIAAGFEIAAPTKPIALPAPQSGWFDIGYTAPANPPWKRLLAGLCEASRPTPVSALGAQCAAPFASNIGIWRMSFQAAGVEGAFSARDWHLNIGSDDGISVLVASALQTPLDDFDVTPSWGIQLTVPGGWRFIGTSSGVDLVQADVSFGQVFGGVAPQGAFAGVQFDGDTVSGAISALSSVGQVQIIGDVTARLGEFTIGSTLSTSDFSFAVSRVLRNRAMLQLSWSTSDGFGTVYVIPGGPTAKLSWSGDYGFKIAVMSVYGIGDQPLVAPQGGMALGFSRPDALSPAPLAVDFRMPFASAPVPGISTLPSGSATVVIRLCVQGSTDSACRQAEFRGPVQISVDGQLMAAAGGRVLVSPGYHVITVPVELLPAHLVAVGALTCNQTFAASTVTFCDLPVRGPDP
jgi:hypothetical protein